MSLNFNWHMDPWRGENGRRMSSLAMDMVLIGMLDSIKPQPPPLVIVDGNNMMHKGSPTWNHMIKGDTSITGG